MRGTSNFSTNPVRNGTAVDAEYIGECEDGEDLKKG